MEQTAAPRTGLAHIEPRFNALAQACHSSAASAPQLTYTSSLQSIDHSDLRRSFCAPGGTLTELLRDTVALLPPFTAETILCAINRLKVAPLLAGYRGHSAADVPALVEMALACTRYAQTHVDRLVELDINPVIVRPSGLGAVAVDALIRLVKEH